TSLETTHAFALPPQSDEIWVNEGSQDRRKNYENYVARLETRAEILQEKHVGLVLAQFVENKLQLKQTQGEVSSIKNALNTRLIRTNGVQARVPSEDSGEDLSRKHEDNWVRGIKYSEGNLQTSKGLMLQEDTSKRVAQTEYGFIGKREPTNFSASIAKKTISADRISSLEK
ncbi:Hypothetical predicted protein, partial [Olea europaea subsp. europaea]